MPPEVSPRKPSDPLALILAMGLREIAARRAAERAELVAQPPAPERSPRKPSDPIVVALSLALQEVAQRRAAERRGQAPPAKPADAPTDSTDPWS